jgi:putative SOS response-associated peptidase YedK
VAKGSSTIVLSPSNPSLNPGWPVFSSFSQATPFFRIRAKCGRMCGRFARYSLSRELERHFRAHPAPFEVLPDYNVAPTQDIPVIVQQEDERHIRKFHWGLVPFWAKDISIGSRMINARVETVAMKPAFRAAFKQRRCLIPADGFYEWHGTSGNKQPYYFHLPCSEPFAFAGLYENWVDKEALAEAASYRSCTIITMDASDSVKAVHNRMPMILEPAAYAEWLDPEIEAPSEIEAILKSGSVKNLEHHPVSKLVNRIGNNKKECMEPLEGIRDYG